jgi:hypothetical protein
MASVPGSTFGTWRYADSILLGGPGLDFQTCETLEAGVGENEKRRVEVRGSHPSLEKSEGWATQLYGLVKGAPPAGYYFDSLIAIIKWCELKCT